MVIIAKGDAKDKAADVFKDTGIEITVAGKRYLGGALGAEKFLEAYVEEKVSTWATEVEQLSSFQRVSRTRPLRRLHMDCATDGHT